MRPRAISLLLGLLAIACLPVAASAGTVPIVQEIGTAGFSSDGGATPLRTTRTVPHFDFQATDPTNGVTYGLTMVGADPSARQRTVVPSELVPLRLNFKEQGVSLDATSRAVATVASPIFADYAYDGQMAGGDRGQHGDVFMRAQFNALGTGYHVELGPPVVFPTVSIDVPKNQGQAVLNSRGVLVGRVDMTWFGAQIHNLLGQLHIDPTTLPVFLTDNVVLYRGNDPSNCCVIGYHGAHSSTGGGAGAVNSNGNAAIDTFVFAAYVEPNTFRPGPAGPSGIQDVHALGHEIAEWLDDPFVNNAVQPWSSAIAPQYGCSGLLETGDPVVGIWFPLPGNPDPSPAAGGVWHPEDEVNWQWFLRQSPSSAFGGHYTFMGAANPYASFHAAATGCF